MAAGNGVSARGIGTRFALKHSGNRLKRSSIKNLLYLILVLAVYPAAALVLAWFGGRALGEGGAAAVTRIILLSQCVIVACFVPFFLSLRPAGKPIPSMSVAALKAAGIVGATCAIAVVSGLILGSSPPMAWVLKSGAIAIGFAVVLTGVGALAHRLGARAAGGQLVVCLAAALMLGTVFYANPAIAAARGSLKVALIQAAVAGNPLVSVAGSALDCDILVSRESAVSLYNTSLIGPDHLYHYPAWWSVCLVYGVVGFAMVLVSTIGGSRSKSGG